MSEQRVSYAGVCAARTRAELKSFFRQRESVVFTMLFPLILLVLFEAVAAVLRSQAPSIGIGAEALAVLFSQVVSGLRSVASVILIFGLVLAALGLSFGGSRGSAYRFRASR